MRKSRFSDEQIAMAMRQAEVGTPVVGITSMLAIVVLALVLPLT